MASINATPVGTFLVSYDDKTNDITTYTGEDTEMYLAEDFQWEFGFTIPHVNAISDMIDTFVIGSIPPAIPDFKAVYPDPIDVIFMPELVVRFIDVKQKKVDDKLVMLIHVMEARANNAFIKEWVKERKDMEIKNKILGGTPGATAGQIAQPGQPVQITPEQLQQLLASGQVKMMPMNGMPQPPQQKPSGIILK